MLSKQGLEGDGVAMSVNVNKVRTVSIRVTALGIGDEAFAPIVAAALQKHADDIINGKAGGNATGIQSMDICGKRVVFEWEAASFEQIV